jgi:hypothetical protein
MLQKTAIFPLVLHNVLIFLLAADVLTILWLSPIYRPPHAGHLFGTPVVIIVFRTTFLIFPGARVLYSIFQSLSPPDLFACAVAFAKYFSSRFFQLVPTALPVVSLGERFASFSRNSFFQNLRLLVVLSRIPSVACSFDDVSGERVL